MDFQTPVWLCNYMVSLVEGNPHSILEPTPGEGNLVKAIKKKFPNSDVYAPEKLNFENIGNFDYIIANPPFSPMKKGYDLLQNLFFYSNNILIIMPWHSIINSEKRTTYYLQQGLRTVTHIPRRAFNGSRVQTCILHFNKKSVDEIILDFNTLYKRQ